MLIPVMVVMFGTTAFAGEQYQWYQDAGPPRFNINYISSASIAASNADIDYDLDTWNNDARGYFFYDWSFSNTLELPDAVGKFIYGAISMEFDIYIPNPNTTNFEMYSGVISGDPIITETIKIYPWIKSTTTNHYVYQLLYVFDGYQAQTTLVSGPTMTISNLTLMFKGASPYPGNQGISPTGTAAKAFNRLRFEDEPLNRGLVALIAQGLDSSDKLDLMLQYLYDIKMNDIQYYNQLISGVSSLLTQMGNANSTLISILNELDTDFTQVQTVLDLFPSYRTQVLQYWQELLQMNTQQSSAAAEQDNNYATNESKSNDLINGLDSIQFPSISAGDLDIFAGTDANIKSNFFGLIGAITANQFVTKVLLIIVTGMIIGFVLYGKKT